MTDLVSQLVGALELAVRQGEHDMLLTGEELRQCTAALTAAKAGGWVAVPVEPTDEMLSAVDEEVGGHCYSCFKWIASEDDCRRVWTAMLAARPTTPPKEQA